MVLALSDREVIGFYYDHKIAKRRPITRKRGNHSQKIKVYLEAKHILKSINLPLETVEKICFTLRSEHPSGYTFPNPPRLPFWIKKDELFSITEKILENNLITAVFTDYVGKYCIVSSRKKSVRNLEPRHAPPYLVRVLEIDLAEEDVPIVSGYEKTVFLPLDQLLVYPQTIYYIKGDEIMAPTYGFSKKLLILPLNVYPPKFHDKHFPTILYEFLRTPKAVTVCCHWYETSYNGLPSPIYVDYVVYNPTKKDGLLELNKELVEFNMELLKKKYKKELGTSLTDDIIMLEETLKFIKEKRIFRKIGMRVRDIGQFLRKLRKEKEEAEKIK